MDRFLTAKTIPWFCLALVLAGFLGLLCLLPLRTTVQIGADEGFELAKATSCLKGQKLYTQIWNDQPPLHTFVIIQVLRAGSGSILGPRLVTIGFSVVLICALFVAGMWFRGLVTALLWSMMVVGSPGFLELGSSCMLEIPSLALAVVGLIVFVWGIETNRRSLEVLSGLCFGAATLMKLVPIYLLPLVIIMAWARRRHAEASVRTVVKSLTAFAIGVTVGIVFIDLLLEKGAYFIHFQQSWVSHFGAARSSAYGSAQNYPFQWQVFLKHWDAVIPAGIGVVVCVREGRRNIKAYLPPIYLALALLVFTVHKPWWPYYYVHTVIPLCWCAATGLHTATRVPSRRNRLLMSLVIFYGLCALPWVAGRVYLQAEGIRRSPQVSGELVLAEIERLRPFTTTMFTAAPIYSFHAGIPMPGRLAVLPLKRFWSGEMTSERIEKELRATKPEIILLTNDDLYVPFQDLLSAEYRLTYIDANHRLYALHATAKAAGL